MIQKNRSFRSTLLAALLCGTATVSLLAQGSGGPPPGGGGPGGPGGHGHHGPPPSPLFDALDTNHDGTISADEMANASTSLRSLLKNGATGLTRDDLRPAHPPRPDDAAGDPAADGEKPHPKPQGVRPHNPPPRPQDAPDDAADAGGPQAHGDGPRRHGPPPSPLFDALDANKDGTISSEEMGNATASLKTLLKSGATQLTREDLRPAHPPERHEN